MCVHITYAMNSLLEIFITWSFTRPHALAKISVFALCTNKRMDNIYRHAEASYNVSFYIYFIS